MGVSASVWASGRSVPWPQRPATERSPPGSGLRRPGGNNRRLRSGARAGGRDPAGGPRSGGDLPRARGRPTHPTARQLRPGHHRPYPATPVGGGGSHRQPAPLPDAHRRGHRLRQSPCRPAPYTRLPSGDSPSGPVRLPLPAHDTQPGDRLRRGRETSAGAVHRLLRRRTGGALLLAHALSRPRRSALRGPQGRVSLPAPGGGGSSRGSGSQHRGLPQRRHRQLHRCRDPASGPRRVHSDLLHGLRRPGLRRDGVCPYRGPTLPDPLLRVLRHPRGRGGDDPSGGGILRRALWKRLHSPGLPLRPLRPFRWDQPAPGRGRR